MSLLHALLILGRVSNLPTVWSNCLAGWLLGGGDWRMLSGDWQSFTLLCVGATCLYVGGMFLNDACDVEFDRQFRKERPIPSGAISEGAVWAITITLLTVGLGCLSILGQTTALLGLALFNAILFYDFLHKKVTWSPVLMAACRFFLYLAAASIAPDGVTGLAVWGASALACWIIGLSFIAKKESVSGSVRYWPCLFLAAPVGLALVVNAGPYQQKAFLLSVIVVLWALRCLRTTLWSAEKDIGRTVSGLLAGIVFVDLLAVCDVPREIGAAFLGLFCLSLLGQRFVPAT